MGIWWAIRPYLGIDLKLIIEDLVTSFIDGVGRRAIILFTSINWAPLAVPNAKTALVHPLTFLLVTPPKTTLLFFGTSICLGGSGETKHGVIVDGVSGVIPFLVGIPKVRKIRCKGVAIKEDDMVGILRTDGGMYFVIESDKAGVFGIGGLVQGIVACDPFVAFIMLGEFRPQPENPFLEVTVVPNW